MNDGRALSEAEFERIQRDFFSGIYSDQDLARVFETVIIQRRVLREVFGLFRAPPLRRYSHVDPIPNSQLVYLKELVSMEE
jgi:hypothetical protein